jgi:hypothetical protein
VHAGDNEDAHQQPFIEADKVPVACACGSQTYRCSRFPRRLLHER